MSLSLKERARYAYTHGVVLRGNGAVLRTCARCRLPEFDATGVVMSELAEEKQRFIREQVEVSKEQFMLFKDRMRAFGVPLPANATSWFDVYGDSVAEDDIMSLEEMQEEAAENVPTDRDSLMARFLPVRDPIMGSMIEISSAIFLPTDALYDNAHTTSAKGWLFDVYPIAKIVMASMEEYSPPKNPFTNIPFPQSIVRLAANKIALLTQDPAANPNNYVDTLHNSQEVMVALHRRFRRRYTEYDTNERMRQLMRLGDFDVRRASNLYRNVYLRVDQLRHYAPILPDVFDAIMAEMLTERITRVKRVRSIVDHLLHRRLRTRTMYEDLEDVAHGVSEDSLDPMPDDDLKIVYRLVVAGILTQVRSAYIGKYMNAQMDTNSSTPITELATLIGTKLYASQQLAELDDLQYSTPGEEDYGEAALITVKTWRATYEQVLEEMSKLPSDDLIERALTTSEDLTNEENAYAISIRGE